MVDGWYKGLFEYLEKEVPDFQKLIGDPKRIFNADESGFPISVTSKKVLAPQGSRHVYQVLSSDKTQITVMACLNASGDYMPPLIVYPGQRFRDDALSGFPEAIYGHSANGWMDSDLFLSFLREFNAFVDDKSIHKPVILFVDGHSTHISRVAAEYCADNSIILYCLLANATHVLQACDIGLFSPMKMKWSVAVKAWQMENLGQPFTKYHFPSVFKTAWDKVTTLANSISAFKRSGLYPLSIKGIDLSKLGPSKLSAPLIQPELTKSVNVDHVSMACTFKIPSSDSSSDPCTSSGSVQATVPSSNQAELTKSVNVDQVSMACTLQIPSSDSSSDPCTSSGSVQATVPSSNPSTDISVQQSTPLLQQPLKILSQNVRSPDYVSPAFFKLRVPEIKAKKTNNTLRGKLPKALSGSVALKMMKERDEKKKKEEEEKQARKIERERKKLEREQEKEKKKRERELKKAFKKKMKCKKSDKCSDSENENEEMEISYMDDSDYDEAEVCPGCHSAEGLPEEWIGCDSCSRWWHIECTDIEEFVGKTASEISGYNFTCEFC
ncbi:uncharacterized protein LOC132739337 [Ruditapes philippinarum]|uniref:uncharacterized protein LOC132739337 n=1 Tax=Ruditapes philippinarum TaxID=129788 RepID=UPI00295B1731|nr:uncharacterized protein LOC132739337 [Ruditapes philippinarum]